MPKKSFMGLPEEKKNRILEVAKNEILGKRIQDISINKIVKECGIARGSFYNYFEDIDDIFFYIIKNQIKEVRYKLMEFLDKTNGDLINAFKLIYDEVLKGEFTTNFQLFQSLILTSISDDKYRLLFVKNKEKNKENNIQYYMGKIDKSKIRDEFKDSIEDYMELIINITIIEVEKVITNNDKESIEKLEKSYKNKLDIIAKGIYKN